MARIYQRKNRSGYWYLDCWTNGQRVRKKLSKDKRLAEQLASAFEADLLRGKYDIASNNISLADFWTKSLEYATSINSDAQAERIGYMLAHFTGFLRTKYPGLSRVEQLSPDVFFAFQQHRLGSVGKKTRKPLKKKTVNLELKALKTMMNRAIEWGYLRENPCRVKSVKETDSKKVRSLTEQEAKKLLDMTDQHWLHPVIRTMLFSGLRLGECRFLTWEDIDFERKVIFIRRKDGWIPKSSGGEIRERDVYIGDDLVAFLQRHKLSSAKDKWVFHDSHGNQLAVSSSIPFRKVLEDLGFKDVGQLHALRHTYITHLLRAGNDIVTVQEQAGHCSILTTRGYIDAFEDRKRKAAQSLTYTQEQVATPTGALQATT